MARFQISKNARWFLPAVALGVVLALLGLLQYRANRQLRDVLQQQMLTEAQTSLMRIRRGLEDVFRPICTGLASTPPSSLRQANLQNYASAALRVRGATAHPAFVSKVFVYQGVNLSHPQLFEIADGEEKFHIAAWPSNLTALRDYLVQLAPAF
jgi:hypothetical protein